jgi:uncharacterized membrane protein
MKALLIVLGAPLWIPLLIAALAVLLSLYLSLWAIVLSLWAVCFSALFAFVYGSACGIGLIALGHFATGLAFLGAGVAAVGLTLLLWLVCRATGRAMLYPTKSLSLWLERRRYRV